MKSAVCITLVVCLGSALPAGADDVYRAVDPIQRTARDAVSPPALVLQNHSITTISLRSAIRQEAARLQRQPQAPPRPVDIIPTLHRRSGRHCSVAKGIAVGAAVGAGVGIVAGALTADPNGFGGRVLPALALGGIGAGVGAVNGWAYCRR
jgi:hypothetical protein